MSRTAHSRDWLGERLLAEPEEMDAPHVDAARLHGALRFIQRVNRWLGYSAVTLRHLDNLVRDIPRNRVLRILDVATGSADVPVAINIWAKRSDRRVEVVGLDLHQTTLDFAVTCAPHVPLIRGDALQLPFDDGAFDIVMTNMFLHHLPTSTAANVLKEMDRVASHGVIAADLLRTAAAHRWATLFTLTADAMVKHDARVSVKQAFTMSEAKALCDQAGLSGASVHKHFAHRFVITKKK